MQAQLTLFEGPPVTASDLQVSRSGTFIDNMALPIHRWFRYPAGFAAQWVGQVLEQWRIKPGQIVLDPFAGSGTVPVVCDSLGISSIGVEAHPMAARICKAKLLWTTPVERVTEFAAQVLRFSRNQTTKATDHVMLLQRSYDEDVLAVLDGLKTSWMSLQDRSPESELVWLALTAILRSTSKVGTAQWQYILPNKTKKKVLPPLLAFQQQIEMIKSDMRWMQLRAERSQAEIIAGDVRTLASSTTKQVDAVITSPPYANNYDYADALRFEMTFWGEVNRWGDIHDKVRKYLIVSSSQHSSRERLKLEDLLESEVVKPIRKELEQVAHKLAIVRESHGGKKHYHTMIAAYCRDIGLALQQLRRVCRSGARMCWVIGDSAPYGIYCPIEEWIAQLAMAAGFESYHFDKLRDRNIKWKNRKHTVPLKEGLLWIEG
jgi:DNA modification methylase